MKLLGTALQAKKLDQPKAYKHVPDVVEKLAKLSKFQDKYNKVSFARVDVDASGSQVKLLGDKCPDWLKQLSNDVLVYCFEDQMKSGDYKISFMDVDVSLVPPIK